MALFHVIFIISLALIDGVLPCLASRAPHITQRAVCTVLRDSTGGDDAPAITAAFRDCGKGGKVVFTNHTYHINSVMNTTGLSNCYVELHGTLLWSTNTTYWLDHSMPIGYQNQSSAWFIGGSNITFDGFGYGTFDGNGQVWYDLVNGISNYPHRPHALTIWNTRDSLFQGIRFVQSQMWTLTTTYSGNVLLQDIYVNSTSWSEESHRKFHLHHVLTSQKAPARNTDGADTIFSNNITFRRWSVDNGDDAIAIKANSSNILIEDSVFRRGQGIAVGSIGQYNGEYEFVQNFVARNITLIGTRWAGYIKTWTGVKEGYPPNGGGGGIGYIRNILWENFQLISNRGVLDITQCTSFGGYTGSCNTSALEISDLEFRNFQGTVEAGVTRLGTFDCSGAAPCHNITVSDMYIETVGTGLQIGGYGCTAVDNSTGFGC